MKFTRNGKQVLKGGKHFADAADEPEARMIVRAMNKYFAPLL